MPEPSPAFQIVIVLYNSARWIGPCLRAVRALRYPKFETWVVDNTSSDGGADLVAREFPEVTLLRSDHNRGFAAANNWGAAQAPSTDCLFLLNPDTELHPDSLTRLAEAFAAHSTLGVAGCKILGPDGKIQHVGGELRANALSYHVGEGEPDEGQYTGLRTCTYVQGAAFAVRRSLWQALGGFDESFSPAYFEEADFCRRARQSGAEVAVVCEASVIHHQDPRAQVQSRAFLEMLFRGRARYLLKHYTAREWLTRYGPAELRWLLSRDSKRYRRIALRTLWEVWSGAPPGIHG